MAAVSDAKTAVASSANWFKIHETGLIGTNPTWWADDLLNVSQSVRYRTCSDVIPRPTVVATPSPFPTSLPETTSFGLRSLLFMLLEVLEVHSGIRDALT
jgi:hypothetical protein